MSTPIGTSSARPATPGDHNSDTPHPDRDRGDKHTLQDDTDRTVRDHRRHAQGHRGPDATDYDLDRNHTMDRDTGYGLVPRSREEATARQKEQFGGIKVGSAFFGWLTATGATVLLTAIVVAAGATVGVATGTSLDQATTQAEQGSSTAQTVGVVGAIALLVVVFLAYIGGGYVAGRMARFNGLKQGLAVWLWTILIAVVVAVLAAIAGSKFNILDKLNAFPRIPTGGNLTTIGLIALAAVAIASLAGALLGGLAGMRFHRKVDQAAFTSVPD